MRRIHSGGQVWELPERDYLQFLADLADGELRCAEDFYRSHSSGFPDVDRKLLVSLVQEASEHLHSLFEQIDDAELREMFFALERLRRRFVEIDDLLITEIAKFFDLPVPKSIRGRRKILREMDKYGTSGGPVWKGEPGYQQILQETEQALSAVIEFKNQIDEKIVKLGEELGST